jgi:predicted secreted Zn-dependent protease
MLEKEGSFALPSFIFVPPPTGGNSFVVKGTLIMKLGTLSFSLKAFLCMILLAVMMVTLQACADKDLKPAYQTEYQAIFTTSGHVLFGKIEKVTPTYIIVRDVYVTQSRIDPITKETVQFVANRVNQYHKPDVTYLNPASVAMTEPVAPDSQVAKWIKDEKERTQTKK